MVGVPIVLPVLAIPFVFLEIASTVDRSNAAIDAVYAEFIRRQPHHRAKLLV